MKLREQNGSNSTLFVLPIVIQSTYEGKLRHSKAGFFCKARLSFCGMPYIAACSINDFSNASAFVHALKYVL